MITPVLRERLDFLGFYCWDNGSEIIVDGKDKKSIASIDKHLPAKFSFYDGSITEIRTPHFEELMELFIEYAKTPVNDRYPKEDDEEYRILFEDNHFYCGMKRKNGESPVFHITPDRNAATKFFDKKTVDDIISFIGEKFAYYELIEEKMEEEE